MAERFGLCHLHAGVDVEYTRAHLFNAAEGKGSTVPGTSGEAHHTFTPAHMHHVHDMGMWHIRTHRRVCACASQSRAFHSNHPPLTGYGHETTWCTTSLPYCQATADQDVFACTWVFAAQRLVLCIG